MHVSSNTHTDKNKQRKTKNYFCNNIGAKTFIYKKHFI